MASEQFSCDKCNKTYKRKGDLTRHKNKNQCDQSKQNKTKISKALKQALWKRDFNTNKEGKCYVCERILYDDDFHAAHILAEANGGNTTIDNLRITCRLCNLSCATKNLDEFKKTFKSTTESKHKNEIEIIEPEIKTAQLTIDDFNIIDRLPFEMEFVAKSQVAKKLCNNITHYMSSDRTHVYGSDEKELIITKYNKYIYKDNNDINDEMSLDTLLNSGNTDAIKLYGALSICNTFIHNKLKEKNDSVLIAQPKERNKWLDFKF